MFEDVDTCVACSDHGPLGTTFASASYMRTVAITGLKTETETETEQD